MGVLDIGSTAALENTKVLGNTNALGSITALENNTEYSWRRKEERKSMEKKFSDGTQSPESRNDTRGIRMVRLGEKEYPKRLSNIPGPPKQLYYMGELPREEVPSVAVIGARDCSEYGKFVARRLGETLGRNGVQVISGMARGIDGITQQAALEAGGRSFAVLGSGVDVCYPSSNRPLYEKLKVQGGILSEYIPGTKALGRLFPPRNRIVSGLADVLIVVEAREKSGTLITTDMALEQGKDVYVVPGRITDRLSDGCNRLLRMGAGVILNPEDFVEELLGIQTKGEEHALMPELSPEAGPVFQALDYMPLSIGEIHAKLPHAYEEKKLLSILLELCMEEMAVQVSPGYFCRKG